MQKNRFVSMACLVLAVVAFSGCAKKVKVDKVESDPVSERLIEASNSAASSLKVLARVNNAKAYKSLTKEQISQDVWQNRNIPFNLDKKFDIDKWSGPIETVLSNLAEVSNYRFRVSGAAPVPPILVHVSGKERMVVDYLYDLGYQAGDRADILIYPPEGKESGVIDLRYLYNQSEIIDTWNGN